MLLPLFLPFPKLISLYLPCHTCRQYSVVSSQTVIHFVLLGYSWAPRVTIVSSYNGRLLYKANHRVACHQNNRHEKRKEKVCVGSSLESFSTGEGVCVLGGLVG
jgi:hypothetical protein